MLKEIKAYKLINFNVEMKKLITFDGGWWWLRFDQSWKLYWKLLMLPWRRITRKWTMFDQKIYKADSSADEYTLTQTNVVSGISLPNLKLV